jgi:hypothetical protein
LEKEIKLKLKLLRRFFRRFKQSLRYGSEAVNHSPILFANSFPKSGTHLLIQILAGFSQIGPVVNSGLPPIVTFEGRTGQRRSTLSILAEIKMLKSGDIAYGHLHAEPEIIDQLSSNPFATYNIIRDPRDVVVSHVHYITELAPEHIHHKYFMEELHNFDERLKYSITGSPGIEIRINQDQPGFEELPDIRSRLIPFLGWLDVEGVFNARFETLITDPDGSILQMLEFAGEKGFIFNKNQEAAIEVLKENINPRKSPTFRNGKTGGWKKAFNEENKSIFKEIAGDLLIQLGYETDLNW